MEKLLLLTLIIPSLLAFALQTKGIDPDRVSGWTANTVFIEEKFSVKRITLKTGVELEYAEQRSADGIPVVFLHGLSDSWHSFETTLPHLPENIHAFALSQRGHGNSGSPASNYAPRDFAADVASFVSQKGLGPVVIVGHSMGGVNAMRFAVDHPELTKALVIVNSDPALIHNEGMPEFVDLVKNMKGNISRQFMVEFQGSTLAKPIDSAYFNLLVNEGMKLPLHVLQQASQQMLEIIDARQLKTIKVPTAIFWGDKDAFCQLRGQQALAGNITHAKTFTYPGTGHALHWEEPARFAADLCQFIKIMEITGIRLKPYFRNDSVSFPV